MHTLNSFLCRGRCAARGPFLLAVAALALSACDDPFKLKASYGNEPFVYSLYGISGTGPANAPAALDLVGRSPVRVDGNFKFDIAFDFDGRGKIVILPQKLVGTPITGSRTVALQRISGSYESVLLAPTKGWQLDSALSVLPGEVIGVRLTSASCVYQLSSEMYAKLVVDSVRTGGLIFGRGVMNPNCGFKSFAEGIPEK
ncbi:MAG: hypothetical protein C0497_14535 [Gemmatimonas sp.]|nr:hypothetical protein [Gemmatimonas sp.]